MLRGPVRRPPPGEDDADERGDHVLQVEEPLERRGWPSSTTATATLHANRARGRATVTASAAASAQAPADWPVSRRTRSTVAAWLPSIPAVWRTARASKDATMSPAKNAVAVRRLPKRRSAIGSTATRSARFDQTNPARGETSDDVSTRHSSMWRRSG